jgi:uncharacterized membrane protein
VTARGDTFDAAAEQRLDQMIGTLLRLGVLCATVVASAGGIVFLVRHGAEPPAYGVFRGEPQDLRSLRGIVADVLALRGRGLIQLGLLLLLATPVARVALTLVAFTRLGDRRYVVITAIVFGLLLFSLLGGPS